MGEDALDKEGYRCPLLGPLLLGIDVVLRLNKTSVQTLIHFSNSFHCFTTPFSDHKTLASCLPSLTQLLFKSHNNASFPMTTDSSWPRWLSVTGTVFYYALYPVFLLLMGLWYILILLCTPFVYIGSVIANISLIPWRIFARFEVCSNPVAVCNITNSAQAVWYFLGSAALLGLLLGLTLHFTMRAFVVIFRLDRKPIIKPKSIPAKGHDAVSYRKARDERKGKQLEEQQKLASQARLIASQPLIQEVVREVRKMPLSSGPPSPLSPFNRAGLLRQTILEHSDEDEDDSVF